MIIYQVCVYIVVYLRDIYLMCDLEIYLPWFSSPSSSPILCSVIHHLLQFYAMLSMGWVYMELDKYHCAMIVPMPNITSTKRIMTLIHNIQYALYMVGKRIYFNIFLKVSYKCKIHYANADKNFLQT